MRADSTGEYCASSHRVMMSVKRCESSDETPRLCSSSRTFSLVRLATGMLNLSSRYGDRWLGFDEQQLGLDLAAAGFAVLHCKHMQVNRNMTMLLLSAEAR